MNKQAGFCTKGFGLKKNENCEMTVGNNSPFSQQQAPLQDPFTTPRRKKRTVPQAPMKKDRYCNPPSFNGRILMNDFEL